jgi:hypothetical protein
MSDLDIASTADSGESTKLRATFTAGSHFSGPVSRISWKEPREDRRPIVLVVAGCAFSVAGAEFAPDAIRLSVEESGTGLNISMAEACREKNPLAINAVVTRHLDFMSAISPR